MPKDQRTKNGRMQATLIRFGPNLLDLVKEEARAEGVSVAQFVREAVLLRVAYMSGRRGDRDYEDALAEVARPEMTASHATRSEAQRLREENRALVAENRQARNQAARLRREAAGRRERVIDD